MPRTKFTPNQVDLQAIKSFLKSVSWGSECTLCTQLDGSRAYLMSTLIVWIPCHWQNFEKQIEFCKAKGKKLNLKPGFIFYDRAPDYDCDRIIWQAYREGFVVEWTDVHNRVQHSGFLVRAMDGNQPTPPQADGVWKQICPEPEDSDCSLSASPQSGGESTRTRLNGGILRRCVT